MKYALVMLAVVGLNLALSPSAFASDKKLCKVTTTDIGTIVGRGPSSAEAFEDAATQCFDRRAQLYKMKKGKDVQTDEDAGLVMIDVCANIKCG